MTIITGLNTTYSAAFASQVSGFKKGEILNFSFNLKFGATQKGSGGIFGSVAASTINCESVQVGLDANIETPVGIICHTLDSDSNMIITNITSNTVKAYCVVNGYS